MYGFLDPCFVDPLRMYGFLDFAVPVCQFTRRVHAQIQTLLVVCNSISIYNKSGKMLHFLDVFKSHMKSLSQQIHISLPPALNIGMLGQQLSIKYLGFWHLHSTNTWQLSGLLTLRLCSVRQGLVLDIVLIFNFLQLSRQV